MTFTTILHPSSDMKEAEFLAGIVKQILRKNGGGRLKKKQIESRLYG
jgi:hypothetical protein